MLQSTFVHIPRVGKRCEEQIWRSDIWKWQQFLDLYEELPMPVTRKLHIASYLKKSIEEYERSNFLFFSKTLDSSLHWRAYPDCKKIGFLDIETTGLSKQDDEVTIIGIYDGEESKIFINGKNMSQFQHEIRRYDMLVTFNGRCFDIPFLKTKFPKIHFDQFHVDLRFLMRSIGFCGGLKKIEKIIGIERKDSICDIDGFEAVRLWHRYRSGDSEALGTLIDYNKADIENLKAIMDFAYDTISRRHLVK